MPNPQPNHSVQAVVNPSPVSTQFGKLDISGKQTTTLISVLHYHFMNRPLIKFAYHGPKTACNVFCMHNELMAGFFPGGTGGPHPAKILLIPSIRHLSPFLDQGLSSPPQPRFVPKNLKNLNTFLCQIWLLLRGYCTQASFWTVFEFFSKTATHW